MLLTKPIVLFTVILSGTIIFILFFWPSSSYSHEQNPMARNFILWLHGLGDSGPANEPIKTLFTSPEFKLTKWSFPSAPNNPVTCNCKYLFIYFNFYHCGFFFTWVLVCFSYFSFGDLRNCKWSSHKWSGKSSKSVVFVPWCKIICLTPMAFWSENYLVCWICRSDYFMAQLS